ncbi:MAG: ComEC/Rec2 family competence protein [Acidimicrobiales bacterium]|nr:ComEC/Rec2 family competence protein [Acidimicrobiales bacterium]
MALPADTWPVVAASAAVVGAYVASPIPWWTIIPLGVVAAVVRRPIAGVLLLVVVTNVLAVRSLDGLDPPPSEDFTGVVTLVTDPEPTIAGGLRFEVSSMYGHLIVDVRSPTAAEALESLLAGDRARVAGVTDELSRPTAWSRSRHLAGTLRIESVVSVTGGSAPTEAANAYRRLLDRGAATLEPTQRSLLAGLVLGDDRAQPPQLTADFRAAGLTHLLAVSGQNVAFVMVVAGPFLRRLRIWPRFLLAVTVIGAFAVVTRFEPSVLRAAFVAVVALYAHTTARPSGSVRHLAIAICILVVVDPLLVHSLGFRLSVAATLGVLVLAPRIAARLHGPRLVREGLAVTTGAQLAVAPVLIPTLGPMPLAALPANVAAGPIAGALMVWGLAAGTVAGIVGGPVAALVHLPSAIGLDLLERIAAVGASLPLGTVDLRHVGLLTLCAVVAVRLPAVRVGALALASIVVIAPVVAPEVRGARSAGWGATVWVDGPVAVVELDRGADPVIVLKTLRETRTSAVGLIIVRSARPTLPAVVAAVQARFPVGAVIGPPGLDVPDLVMPPGGFRSVVGRFEVVVDRVGPPMRVRVGWLGHDAPIARAPG